MLVQHHQQNSNIWKANGFIKIMSIIWKHRKCKPFQWFTYLFNTTQDFQFSSMTLGFPNLTWVWSFWASWLPKLAQNHDKTLETWQTLFCYWTSLKFVVKLGKCAPLRGFAYVSRKTMFFCICVFCCQANPSMCVFCCCWMIVMVWGRLGPKVYPKPSNTFDNWTNLWFCMENWQIFGEFENTSLSNDLHTSPIQA